MIDNESKPVLRVRDVARRLEVSTRRVRQIPARELPYRQLEARGHRTYDERDVSDYLERRTVRG